jgi:hypothetical protein
MEKSSKGHVLVDGSLVENLNSLEFEAVGKGIRQVIYTFACGAEVKGCGKCRSWLPLEDFSVDQNSKTGLGFWCKSCSSANTRKHYKSWVKDQSWLDSKRQKGRDLASVAKQKAVDYMGNKCYDCELSYPDYIYDFHHLSGNTKIDNPSAILKRSWEEAKNELDKCVMLCANCHRERHYGSR